MPAQGGAGDGAPEVLAPTPGASPSPSPSGSDASSPKTARRRPSAFDKVVPRYTNYCYRVLGNRLDQGEPDEVMEEALRQAGMHVSPGLHKSVRYITTGWAAVAVCLVSFLIFIVLIPTALGVPLFLLVTAVGIVSVYFSFGFVLTSRTSNRKSQLDREIPFTLSELSVMASTGMPPIQLVRRMARRDHDPGMTAVFQAVVYKVDIQGKDLITAMAETAKESPSTTVRESLWDLSNMIHQGGNLDEYLRNKSDDVLKLKRLVQKEFIERLQTFVDMYISLVLVGVLMIAVGAFLLNAFGSTAAGLNADELLLLLTYGIVPLAVIVTAVLMSVAYARAE